MTNSIHAAYPPATSVDKKFTRSHLMNYLIDAKGYGEDELKGQDRDALCDLIDYPQDLINYYK